MDIPSHTVTADLPRLLPIYDADICPVFYLANIVY